MSLRAGAQEPDHRRDRRRRRRAQGDGGADAGARPARWSARSSSLPRATWPRTRFRPRSASCPRSTSRDRQAGASPCVTSSSPAAAEASASRSRARCARQAIASSRSRGKRERATGRGDREIDARGTGVAAFRAVRSRRDRRDARLRRGAAQGVRPDLRPRQQRRHSATDGLLATMHDSQIERLIRLNTLSPIMLTKYVVRPMMADGGGRIVNISSIIGFDRLQRPVGLRRDQGLAGRLHALARARGRAARHHRQRRRARLYRHGDDRTGWTTTSAHQIVARAARCAGSPTGRRCRRRRRVPSWRQGAQHHRHRADGRCRQHRVTTLLRPRLSGTPYSHISVRRKIGGGPAVVAAGPPYKSAGL